MRGDGIIGAVRSWLLEDAVVRGVYQPPAWRFRAVGDVLAGIGTLGLVMPMISWQTEYPPIYPGVDIRVNLVFWAVIPFIAATVIWLMLLFPESYMPYWQTRSVIFVIGAVGTYFTGQWAWQAIGPGATPAWDLTWLGIGSVLVFVGGVVALPAVIYGEIIRKREPVSDSATM